jgi:hypothetical protein
MADPRLKRFGLSGYNKPKRTPRHKTKSHVVLARYKKGGKTVPFLSLSLERTLQRVRVQPLGGQIRLNGVLVRLKGNDGYIKSFFNQYS